MTVSRALKDSDLSNVVVPSGSDWQAEVENDLEGEQETLPDLSDQVEPPSVLKRKADEMDDDNEKAQKLKSNVARLSKGVTEKTHDEYIRYVFRIIPNEYTGALNALTTTGSVKTVWHS